VLTGFRRFIAGSENGGSHAQPWLFYFSELRAQFNAVKRTFSLLRLSVRFGDKEMNMKIKHLSILSAIAVALLSLSGVARADGVCSANTLKGAYAFSAHGEILGVLDTTNELHRFATPSILDDVALVTFDGSGQFARTDFGNIDGVPKGGQTAFNPNQSGTYTVNPDCTGTMTIRQNGVVLGLEIVIADSGTVVKSMISTETVPSSGPAADGTTCTSGCAVGVQVSLEGKKVVAFGNREESRK
jgi:hypothetical protein